MKAHMSNRLTILLIALLPVLPIFGQISVGASIGGLLSTPKAHVSDGAMQIKMPAQRRASYTMGIHADLPLGESGFRIMPSLNFSDKGFLARTEVAMQQTRVIIDMSHRMGFLELGLPFGFAAGIGDHHIFFGAGPYAAVATGGRVQTNASINGVSNSSRNPIKFGSGAGAYDRMDYGAVATVGLVFSSGLFIRTGYVYGLPDLSNDLSNPLRQRCATLSAGYFFLR